MTIDPSPAAELFIDLLKRSLTGLLHEQSGWQIREDLNLNGQPVKLAPGLVLLEEKPLDVDNRVRGNDWPFIGETMIGMKRLDNVRHCVEHVLKNDIPGDFLEAGVWRGGCGIFMRALLHLYGVTNRSVWLADSFEGMPKPNQVDLSLAPHQADISHVSQLRVSLEQVQANFSRYGLLDGQVKLIKGWFKDSLPNAPVERLAILRLDADLFESTMDGLNALYHKVSPGGFVIFDDYYNWLGCRTAVTQFRQHHGISAPIETIDWAGVFWQIPQP